MVRPHTGEPSVAYLPDRILSSPEGAPPASTMHGLPSSRHGCNKFTTHIIFFYTLIYLKNFIFL
jgi:hypothetical protein